MPSRRLDETFPAGKAWFMISDGVVHDYQFNAWASTHVSSGATTHSVVTSSVRHHSRTSFWINDGQNDTNVVLNSDFAIANGHRARIIWGGAHNTTAGDCLFLRNSNTGSIYPYKNDLQLYKWAVKNRLIRESKVPFFGLLGCVVLLFLFPSLLHFFAHSGIPGLFIVGLFLVLCVSPVILPIYLSRKYREKDGEAVRKQIVKLLVSGASA